MNPNIPKTILPVMSYIPVESKDDKLDILKASFIPSIKETLAEKTTQRLEVATQLVPEVGACITTGRSIDVQTMVRELNQKGISIDSVEYPWATNEKQALDKAKASSAMQALAEYLVHVSPSQQQESLLQSTTLLNTSFSLKIDSNQTLPALEQRTIKNLLAVADHLPDGVPLQVLMEPNKTAFQEIEQWFAYVKDFNMKYGEKINILYSMDMPNLQQFTTEGNSLTYLNELIRNHGLKVEEIGAIELSGFDEKRGKDHSAPWRTPFATRDLFLLLRDNNLKIPIVLETHPAIYKELIAGLKQEYVKVMDQVFNK